MRDEYGLEELKLQVSVAPSNEIPMRLKRILNGLLAHLENLENLTGCKCGQKEDKG